MPIYRVSEKVTYEVEAHCEGCAMDAWIEESPHKEVGWEDRDIFLYEGDEPADPHEPEENF